MGKRVRETERKYEAADPTADPEPDLTGLPGVAEVRTLEPAELDAVYFDTADLRLATHRTTLRRRTGGDDAGWHLKLPTSQADTRTEVQLPLGGKGKSVPRKLAAEVAVHTRGRTLEPVVRLRNTRRRVHLLDADSTPLAEIAYDHVTAEPGPSWTETEVELLAGGEPALLDAVEERLTAAGLRRSSSPSKLARALGDRLADAPKPPGPSASSPDTAGDAALAYLHAQVQAIAAYDPAVRRDEEDSVHQMRVSTRRLRSALKSFRREFDRTATDPVGEELKWLAAVLGMERDREVLADRLAQRVSELPPSYVPDPARTRLRGGPGASHATARKTLLGELDGDRYFALLDTLDALLAAPPLLDAAKAPAAPALTRTVRRDHRRLRGLVESALALEPGHERDLSLHEARKAAKRARYSSEAAQPVLGKPAAKHTKRMKGIQQLLGEHQDSVIARDAVVRLADEARAAGEDTFAYGALAQLERGLAARAEAAVPGAWREADQGELAG
ncbi:CYTH and CHAD domain-containing protein [Streptomyces sp. NBC_01262]|uniref:CYTH and CHAD domain-containing protein n=1 Tax=Streptomyces sp. NBC_01262 TaxID=2903803 RepID=UPI002E34CBB2|nr:CYTH and CHAD domain-containing protein [Streptomyces sp. NBC_01262]